MKYIKEEVLINKKLFSTTQEHKKIRKEIVAAIRSITWQSQQSTFLRAFQPGRVSWLHSKFNQVNVPGE
jgi:hypothetical protein